MKKIALLLALNFSILVSAASNDITCTSSQEQVGSLLVRVKNLEEMINQIKQASNSPKKTYQCAANIELEELNKMQNAYVTNVYDTYRAESEELSNAEEKARLRCNTDLTAKPSLKNKGALCKVKECSAVEAANNQNQSAQFLTRIKQIEENHEILKVLLAQMVQPKQPHYTCEAQTIVRGTTWTITGEGSNPSEAQRNAYNFCYDRLSREGLGWFCELLPCKRVAE